MVTTSILILYHKITALIRLFSQKKRPAYASLFISESDYFISIAALPVRSVLKCIFCNLEACFEMGLMERNKHKPFRSYIHFNAIFHRLSFLHLSLDDIHYFTRQFGWIRNIQESLILVNMSKPFLVASN